MKVDDEMIVTHERPLNSRLHIGDKVYIERFGPEYEVLVRRVGVDRPLLWGVNKEHLRAVNKKPKHKDII